MNKCIAPPPLDDLELLLFLDGEAEKQVVAHIKQCAYCRQRGESLLHSQTMYHRLSCPSSEDLRDYHFRLLSGHEMGEITDHLAKCPHCAREVLEDYVSLNEPIQKNTSNFDVTAKLKLFIAQLTKQSKDDLLPAFMTRDQSSNSGENVRQFTFRGNDLTGKLIIRSDPENEGFMILEGDIFSDVEVDFEEFEIHLWHDDQVIIYPLDEVGDFAFNQLSPGLYTFILSSPEQKISVTPKIAVE